LQQHRKATSRRLKIIKICGFNYLGILNLHLLASRHAVLTGVDKVADAATEARLENDAGQGEQRQPGVVPAGHAADEDVRVGGQSSKVELLAARSFALRHLVDGERGAFVAAPHVHLVPVAVVQVAPHRQHLGAAAQVVPESQRALHQLDLEEVVGAAVVRVQKKPVRQLRLELELQRAVQTGVPLVELRERRLRALQHETHDAREREHRRQVHGQRGAHHLDRQHPPADTQNKHRHQYKYRIFYGYKIWTKDSTLVS